MDQGIVLLLEWMILAMDLLTLVMIYKQVSWCFFFLKKLEQGRPLVGEIHKEPYSWMVGVGLVCVCSRIGVASF